MGVVVGVAVVLGAGVGVNLALWAVVGVNLTVWTDVGVNLAVWADVGVNLAEGVTVDGRQGVGVMWAVDGGCDTLPSSPVRYENKNNNPSPPVTSLSCIYSIYVS